LRASCRDLRRSTPNMPGHIRATNAPPRAYIYSSDKFPRDHICICPDASRSPTHLHICSRADPTSQYIYTHWSFETCSFARGPDVGLNAPHRDPSQSPPDIQKYIRVRTHDSHVYTFPDICSPTTIHIYVPLHRAFIYTYTHVRVLTHITEYIHICRAHLCAVVAQYISSIYSQEGVMCSKGALAAAARATRQRGWRALTATIRPSSPNSKRRLLPMLVLCVRDSWCAIVRV
jgi:hypothetical protein